MALYIDLFLIEIRKKEHKKIIKFLGSGTMKVMVS